MDIKTLESLILSNKVKKTRKEYDFDNFNALCRYIGVPTKKGGSERKYYEKQFKQFFDWKKVPGTNKLKITATYYSKPHRISSKRIGIHWTALNKPIAYLLILHPELYGKPISKYTILKTINLMRQRPTTLLDTRSHTYDMYIYKMYGSLESALTQMQKTDMLKVHEEFVGECYGLKVRTTKSNAQKYKAIYNEVCKIHGVKSTLAAKFVGRYDEITKMAETVALKILGVNNIHSIITLYPEPEYGIEQCMGQYTHESEAFRIMGTDPFTDIDKKIIDMHQKLEDEFWAEMYRRLAAMGQNGSFKVGSKVYELQLKDIRSGKTARLLPQLEEKRKKNK